MAHKQFLGHPGHRSSQPGTRILLAGCTNPPGRAPGQKNFMLLGFRTQHINFRPLATGRETPGHPIGRPLATRSGDPPHPGSHRKNLFMFMCLFFLIHIRPTALILGSPNSRSLAVKEFWFNACGIRGPDVWRNLCEISCSHFPWNLKDENP